MTLSQVCDAFPFILSSSHQVKSVSPAEAFLYVNLLHLLYGNFDKL